VSLRVRRGGARIHRAYSLDTGWVKSPSYFRGKGGSAGVTASQVHKNGFGGIPLVFGRLGMDPGYKGTMHIQSRYILTIAALAFALASGLSNEVSADELKEAKVTQVIQDVRVLPSNASPRPAAVNDDVRHGTAVQTGVQSRSELTFKDQTITRLGEKTIFSVGEGQRAVDLGSGQFLLYAPKKAGGAKVKMGPVTAAISG